MVASLFLARSPVTTCAHLINDSIVVRTREVHYHSYTHSLKTRNDTPTTDSMSLPPSPPPSGLRLTDTGRLPILRFLDKHLEHRCLDVHSYDMLYQVVMMIGDISLLLFPHSHVLHHAVRRHIEMLSDRIVDTFCIFGGHIETWLNRARQAMDKLPDLEVEEEERYENLKVWREVLV